MDCLETESAAASYNDRDLFFNGWRNGRSLRVVFFLPKNTKKNVNDFRSQEIVNYGCLYAKMLNNNYSHTVLRIAHTVPNLSIVIVVQQADGLITIVDNLLLNYYVVVTTLGLRNINFT